MEYIKSHYQIVSTLLFVIFIIVAHIYSPSQYHWTKNTISELGAQGYENKIIMQLGFVLFGLSLAAGILIHSISIQTFLIFIYALSVALTGFFCTKPFQEATSYSIWQSNLHSIFAQVAGIAFSLGILVQLFYSANPQQKYIHLIFFILIIGLSIAFGLSKTYQGIIQRLMYLSSFVWLIKYFHS